MKHVKTITAQEAPARAVLDNLWGDLNPIAWFGFWVGEIQNSLAAWKNSGIDDSVDLEDV